MRPSLGVLLVLCGAVILAVLMPVLVERPPSPPKDIPQQPDQPVVREPNPPTPTPAPIPYRAPKKPVLAPPTGLPVAFVRPSWIGAVGRIEEQCTVWAVRPRLLVTASHCVAYSGVRYDVSYVRGVGEVTMGAVVVWDGAYADGWYVDLALLVPDTPWPVTLSVARILPSPGTVLLSGSYSLQIRQWVAPVTIRALAHVEGKGWVLVVQSDELGGGSSGGAIVSQGAVVGVIVAGSSTTRLHIAVPAGSVARAIRHLERYGVMPSPF